MFHSLKDPWVYDAAIKSTNGGPLKGASRHLKSEKGAIEHAFIDFKKNAVKQNIITREQANQFK